VKMVNKKITKHHPTAPLILKVNISPDISHCIPFPGNNSTSFPIAVQSFRGKVMSFQTTKILESVFSLVGFFFSNGLKFSLPSCVLLA